MTLNKAFAGFLLAIAGVALAVCSFRYLLREIAPVTEDSGEIAPVTEGSGDDRPVLTGSPRIDAESGPEAADTLARLTVFALEHAEFRLAWDEAVRTVSDSLAAQFAGAWMAGAGSGDPGWRDRIKLEWRGSVRFPEVPGYGDHYQAFMLAVTGEVNRRLQIMKGPGGPG